ncbi:ABC transporter permease [Anaerobranca gottschalkii]|uniref:ABC-2 family transporter protein n=1 Tax=Anaerobranca gottschalkii DSM 13577 TaxID=1120990 RepID=A0A1I0C7J3_9FIRM|nr:ABC transporter permease [Anaerobranca gottschalkii]SET15172.1 ABC-2 family transporter protein [Anaerobranca gottschalkii DSM 13577]
MGLLKFEFKKFVKGKRYLWIIFVIFLITTGIYSVYNYQTRFIRYRGLEELKLLEIRDEWEYRQSELVKLRDGNLLSEAQEKQLYYIRDVGRVLYLLLGHTQYGDWDKIIGYQKVFLDNLQLYLECGGEFDALDGIEREIYIAKNQWMLDNNLNFESEKLPISQHLFLKDLGSFLLGKVGIILLLIFFGISYTEEKENNTLNTIKTQPVSNLKLMVGKYLIFLLATVIFILVVFAAGLLIPYLYNGKTLNLVYPQILKTESAFIIIPTSQYLIRNIILFICSASVVYGITILTSKWAQKTLSLYILGGIVLTIGYNGTFFINHPINPFYFLRFTQILEKIPQNTDYLYPLFSLIWTTLFLTLASYLPEQQIDIPLFNKIAKIIQEKLYTKKTFAKGNTRVDRSKRIFNLCIFELRKTIREGQWKVLLIALLIIVVSGHYFLSYLTYQREQGYLNELNWRVDASSEKQREYGSEIARLQKEIDDLIENGDPEAPFYYNKIRSLEALISQNQMLIEKEKEMLLYLIPALEGYKKGEWEPFYQYQLYLNEKTYEYNYFGNINTLSRFTVLASIYEKYWLMERNIKPVFSGEFIPNRYISKNPRLTTLGWGGQQVTTEQFIFENTKMDNSGLFYLKIFYTNYLYLIPLIFFLFFIGTGLAKEKDKKNTFNFLMTQPIREEQFFISKFINGALTVLGTTFIVVSLIVVTGTILERFGDWQYPIVHYNPFRAVLSPNYQGFNFGHGMHFMTLGQYIINGTLLLGAVTIFFIGFANLISVFVKKTLTVFSITTILAVVAFWQAEQKPLDRKFYSPTTYFNIPKIVNGEIGAVLNNPKINFVTGIMVLLLFTMFFLLVGYGCIYIKNNCNVKGWLRLLGRREKNDSFSKGC